MIRMTRGITEPKSKTLRKRSADRAGRVRAYGPALLRLIGLGSLARWSLLTVHQMEFNFEPCGSGVGKRVE